MTLTQELESIEEILSMTVADLRVAQARHDVSLIWRNAMIEALEHWQGEVNKHKIKAVIHGQ